MCSMAATADDVEIAREASRAAARVAVMREQCGRGTAFTCRWANRDVAVLHAVARARTRNLLSM